MRVDDGAGFGGLQMRTNRDLAQLVSKQRNKARRGWSGVGTVGRAAGVRSLGR